MMMKKIIHVFRGIGIILAALFLFAIGLFIWPIYLGIFVLRPKLFFMLYDIKVF